MNTYGRAQHLIFNSSAPRFVVTNQIDLSSPWREGLLVIPPLDRETAGLRTFLLQNNPAVKDQKMIGVPEELLEVEKESKTPVILKERQLCAATSWSTTLSSKDNIRLSHVDESCKGRLVIIEGNIGVGKSTLARKMAKELGYALFMEPTVENPYLEKFYADPHKYALKLQLWILKQRYLTYVEAVKHLISTGQCLLRQIRPSLCLLFKPVSCISSHTQAMA